MKLMVQIVCAIALLAVVIDSVVEQRNKPSCYKSWVEDPDTIDQVYFPYQGKCEYFWQCTAHGAMRMKCSSGMVFDVETNQCGRPDDVRCQE